MDRSNRPWPTKAGAPSAALIALLIASSGHLHAAADEALRFLVRQQDVSADDPVLAVKGTWGAAPSRRATTGQTFHGVVLVCPVDDSRPATIGIGVLDLPGVPNPIIASLCADCYDEERGVPPPAEGWQPWANQRNMDGPISYEITIYPASSRVQWSLNGEALRLEQSELIGPCTRLRVGAELESGEPVSEMWFDDIETWRTKAGWQLFEPNDANWPLVTIGDGVVGYQPTGTMVIYADKGPVAHPSLTVPIVSTQGGAGGPVLSESASGLVLAGRGQDLVSIDIDSGAVTVQSHFSSTITALASSEHGELVGTRDGTVFQLADGDPSMVSASWRLGSPITALAAGLDGALAGTTSGHIYLLPVSRPTESVPSTRIPGRIRSIVWTADQWLVGVETVGYRTSTGRVFSVREGDDGTLRVSAPVGVNGAPIAILPTEDREALIVTAAGHVDRMILGPSDISDGGTLLTLSSPVVGAVGNVPLVHILGDQGEMWTVSIDATGDATIVSERTLPIRGAGFGLSGTRLVATADSGEIGAFDTADGTQVLKDVAVGAVKDLYTIDDSVLALSDHSTLHRLGSSGSGLSIARLVDLPRRGIALRPWPGGLAVANGYAGIDLYNSTAEEWVGRIRLVGVSRDVAFNGEAAYVASGLHGVQVANLTDPHEPVVIGALTTTLPALAVSSAGSSLLVGRQGGNAVAYDTTTPFSPTLIAEIPETPNVVRFEVHGELAYALSGAGTVSQLLIDPTRPDTAPELVATLPASRYGLGLAWSESGLSIASGPDGVQQLMASEETVVQLDLPTTAQITSLASTEDFEIAGGGAAGIQWWRRSDPRIFLPTLENRW